MRSRILRAVAIACACTWAANASAGGQHGEQSDRASGVKVRTPVAVNESAPWLAGKPSMDERASAPEAPPASRQSAGFGTSAASSGGGSVGSDPLAANGTTEYWLIGAEDAKPGIGASASDGAGGSVSFDSTTRASGG